ncbi:MAG TPA: hypothetical protein VKC34_04000 [Blastocatellia bacterium]|nr:hypothetical protein [Blastocatellia bacterium]
MKSRLPLLVFIIMVACNSLAAVTPHADGEGGCSAACCQNAREGGSASALSRLRCLMNCDAPAAHHTAPPANDFASEKQKERPPGIAILEGRTARLIPYLNARRRSGPPVRASFSLYLQTGSLLI